MAKAKVRKPVRFSKQEWDRRWKRAEYIAEAYECPKCNSHDPSVVGLAAGRPNLENTEVDYECNVCDHEWTVTI